MKKSKKKKFFKNASKITAIISSILVGLVVPFFLIPQPNDALLNQPKIFYTGVEKALNLSEYNNKPIRVITEGVEDIVNVIKTTNLENSLVGFLLISLSNDIAAENIEIPYTKKTNKLFTLYGYSHQKLFLDEPIIQQGILSVAKILTPEEPSLALPFCITEKVNYSSLDPELISSTDINELRHIIVEYIFEDGINYFSQSRRNLNFPLNILFKNDQFTTEITPMISVVVREITSSKRDSNW